MLDVDIYRRFMLLLRKETSSRNDYLLDLFIILMMCLMMVDFMNCFVDSTRTALQIRKFLKSHWTFPPLDVLS